MIKYGDVELTMEELLQMIADDSDYNVEIKKDSSPMQKLNYRFSKGVPAKCEDIASQFECFNQSDIARAAIAIGLNQIKYHMKKNPDKAGGFIHIGKIRHDLL